MPGQRLFLTSIFETLKMLVLQPVKNCNKSSLCPVSRNARRRGAPYHFRA